MSAATRRSSLVMLIETYHRDHGFAPSVRELLEATGLNSMSTLHRDLCWLRDEGWIEWDPGRYRTIKVVAAV